MICAGLAAFLIVASPSEGTHVPDAGQWILAVSTRGAAVAGLLLLSRYGSPARRAALFGAATAVVWSLDAAFVKQTVDELARSGVLGLLAHWPLYAMIATGVLGTILLQGAFAVGPLAASQATLLIVDPLVSIALGIELFHEQLRAGPGYVFGAVVSLAVLGAGVVMLSIWAPPVMTAEELARLPGHAGLRPGGDRGRHPGRPGTLASPAAYRPAPMRRARPNVQSDICHTGRCVIH